MKYKKRERNRKLNDFLFKVKFEIEWNMKKIFKMLGRALKNIFCTFFETIRLMLVKALNIIKVITNLLFIVSIFMLLANIEEALKGVNFLKTEYFSPMVYIMLIHFVVVFFSNLLKRKY